MANIFFSCSKISSTFKRDNLNFPRKGSCLLEGSNLVLRIQKTYTYYCEKEKVEYQFSRHEVLFLNHNLIYKCITYFLWSVT